VSTPGGGQHLHLHGSTEPSAPPIRRPWPAPVEWQADYWRGRQDQAAGRDPHAVFTGGPEWAKSIVSSLTANGFDPAVEDTRQVLCVAEEAGEFVGAYRRWKGMARRSGSFDDVRLELADVVITAYVAADVIGFELDRAIEDKLTIVFNRGWREGQVAA